MYTMMLIVSFIAILIASLLLYNELSRYGSPFGGQPWNTNEARPSVYSTIQPSPGQWHPLVG